MLATGYWSALFIFGILGSFVEGTKDYPHWSISSSMILFWVWMIFVWTISFFTSGLPFEIWYKNVFFYGIYELAVGVTNLSHNPGEMPWWVTPF